MDPESKKMLEEILTLEQENNGMLRALRRSMRWSRIMTTVYWLLIIGISVGAFYFLQPYVDQLMKTYGAVTGALKNFQK